MSPKLSMVYLQIGDQSYLEVADAQQVNAKGARLLFYSRPS